MHHAQNRCCISLIGTLETSGVRPSRESGKPDPIRRISGALRFHGFIVSGLMGASIQTAGSPLRLARDQFSWQLALLSTQQITPSEASPNIASVSYRERYLGRRSESPFTVRGKDISQHGR